MSSNLERKMRAKALLEKTRINSSLKPRIPKPIVKPPVDLNKPTENELGGMTVNERLFALGLFDEWDEAVKSRNRNQMIQVLSQCAMTQTQCEETTDTLLANPTKYGF